jgi:hypothetical protein
MLTRAPSEARTNPPLDDDEQPVMTELSTEKLAPPDTSKVGRRLSAFMSHASSTASSVMLRQPCRPSQAIIALHHMTLPLRRMVQG